MVRNPKAKVIIESILEPFIGNPESAKVVLLNLNPSHSPEDRYWHGREDFRNAMFLNLRHKLEDYPFYRLNPAFEGNGAGKWWRSLTCDLQKESKLNDKAFAKRLLVIEWFPYHSETSELPKKLVCESQKYSFQLAKQMLDKEEEGVVCVGMRSRDHWVIADQYVQNQIHHTTKNPTNDKLPISEESPTPLDHQKQYGRGLVFANSGALQKNT